MNDLTPIHPQTNADVYRASTDAAGLCKEIVLRTAQVIQGRKYVKVEGWQAIAVAHGCVASAESVERINDEGCKGFSAVGAIRRMSDGVEIARAEGFVGDDEAMWGKRPVYARRAMAQTRAISRACRSAFAHVVVLIDSNLSTTPAEEMDFSEPVDVTPRQAPKVAGVVTGTQLQEQQASGRKIPAQAKRDGDHERYRAMIDNASATELFELTQTFDDWTSEAPAQWLDSLRDRMELRREELAGQASVADDEAAMDEAFRGTVHSGSAAGLSGRNGSQAAA